MIVNRLIIIGLITILILGSQSCQNRRTNELETHIRTLESSLKEKIEEATKLNSEIASLKQNIEISESKYENLKIQIIENNKWVDNVIKEIGPCVWDGGPFINPLPKKFVKKASSQQLMSILNRSFINTNSPEATLLKIENATAYVKIINDDKLTQGMGTQGAANYINSIIFTLLSLKSIECVDLEFEGGDHAFPERRCIDLEIE